MDSIKLKFNDFKENLFNSHKYWLIYVILIIMAAFSMFNLENYQHPKFEIVILILISLIGIFLIAFYNNHNNKELYKTVFIVLVLFGLITVFIIPIDSVSDEYEHLSRAEITSRGILFPEYVNGSYGVVSSLPDFYKNATDKTVFDISGDTNKINSSMSNVGSAFEQNPFYGYIFSALGVGLAKLLDLNVIWMLWLGRIFNVILYAGLISLAIKKTPILKIQLFAISSLPVCLFQAFSISIDSLCAALGILTIAYFLNMSVNKFERKEIIIFSLLSLLTALCKLPYLGLIFLLLFIPHDNFKEKKFYMYVISAIVAVAVLGLLWNSFYASPALYHSWRSQYFIENNVNVSNQLTFIISHPKDFINSVSSLIYTIPNIFSGFFNFYAYAIEGGEYTGSRLISILLTVFVVIISFYPTNSKIDIKTRIGALIIFIIIYLGTFIVQLLSWNPVGQLTFNGVHTRYFLALFALLPCIFSLYYSKNTDKFDKLVFVFILFFISSMIISLAAKFY